MAEHQVDAVVIGAGPGGYHAAIRLGQLGKKVICVDRDEVGGVCLNWGCIPTKALLHVGEVIRHIDHADAIGLKVPKADVDREGVAKFKTDVVNANVGGVKTLFKANGVEFLYGEASFTSPTEVLVKKKDGGTDTIKAANVVIATGSAPVDVKAWPRDGETIVNSDDAVASAAFRRNCSSSAAASSVWSLPPCTRAWAPRCWSSRCCRRFSPAPISKSARRSGAS